MLPLLFALVASDLDAILDSPKLQGGIVSCVVADDAGKVLYQRNGAMHVMPASNQKLLSNSFALHELGPDYRAETRIWKLPDRTVVDSSGDPMMTHERLQRAANELRLDRSNPVYVHESYRPLLAPGWEWDDLPNKYAAPVTAFTVDRGSIELWSEGEKLWIEPNRYWLKPVRGAKTGPKKVIYDPVRRTLIVEGELPKAKSRIDTLALDQPDMGAASYLGRSFRLTDEVPKAPPDLTLGGPPLKDVIKECLVQSDNNIAENLLLMAAAKVKPLGSDAYADADAALAKFLTIAVGIEAGDCRPQDGSGMSRHNVVTTRAIVKLLQWAAKQPTRDVWLEALAKPGAGTLAERLKGVPFTGKTGTLDMVVALSGYVHTKKDRTLTVSLILNHFACTEREARTVADDFIKKLVEDDAFGTLPAHDGPHETRPTDPCAIASADRWHS